MLARIERGVTLVELVFVLAIVGCLAFFALQDNGYLHQKNQLIALNEGLAKALNYAKITAVSRGEDVYLTALNDKNWALGMALYSAKEKALLYQWQWNFSAWQVHWRGFNGDNALFLAANPQNAAANGKFIFVHKPSQKKTYLYLNRLGRIKNIDIN